MKLYEGQNVRLYDNDDWFDEGTIIKITDTYVDVDFDDWVERFPPAVFIVIHPFETIDIVATAQRGIKIDDYTRCLIR